MSTNTPYSLGSRKSLGQHFLTDKTVINQIIQAAELTRDDIVVEIGPGKGILTKHLISTAGQIFSIELDARLAQRLPSQLGCPNNLTCVTGDARFKDITDLVGNNGKYKMVSNLPYYAANPIIRRFLEVPPKPQCMVVMVQEEVAKAMVAEPGQMGLLSVAVQYYAKPQLVCRVSPQSFHPVPKVWSAVVKMEVYPKSPFHLEDPDAFFSFVKAGFRSPRKKLHNSLSSGLGIQGSSATALIEMSGLDPQSRPASLSIDNWLAMYSRWLVSNLSC